VNESHTYCKNEFSMRRSCHLSDMVTSRELSERIRVPFAGMCLIISDANVEQPPTKDSGRKLISDRQFPDALACGRKDRVSHRGS
jgi:hypothetical protein